MCHQKMLGPHRLPHTGLCQVTVDTMQHLARASGEHPLILSLRHKPTTGDDDERKQDAAKQ
jgi:hypothetical protein